MYRYAAKLNPDNKDFHVTFQAPVNKGDLVLIKGERFIVFEVVHTNGGKSQIVCDRG